MTSATPLSYRGHSTRVMGRAVELQRAGFTPTETRRQIIKEFDVEVHRDTLHRWAHPEAQARRLERARSRWTELRGGRLKTGSTHTGEFKLGRARALRELGLSVNAVATVMNFDFPVAPVTERQLRHALEVGHWPEAAA